MGQTWPALGDYFGAQKIMTLQFSGGRRMRAGGKVLRVAAFLGTAVSATAFANVSAAVPVIPGAAGFGMNTPAGRGGKIFKITNLRDSGAGSLRECVEATGARVCVFEVSGTIPLTTELRVRSPNLTIAGQTAPSPGITIRNAGIIIGASDVLMQHLRFRVGDSREGGDIDNRDALRIEAKMASPAKNIVVDHCTFSWAIDETASIWVAAQDISLTNNIFADPLNDSVHSKGAHGYGVLIGDEQNSVKNVSMTGNLLANIVERAPLSRSPTFVMANNVVYNRAHADLTLQSNGRPTKNAVVGNVFVRGPDYSRNTKPILVRQGDSLAVVSGSTLYVADNKSTGTSTTDPWALVDAGSLLSKLKVTSPPVWPNGLDPMKSDGVLDHVLANAGARPKDRDSADLAVVAGVKNGTGRIINCVSSDGSERCKKNAGGWPKLAENRRSLAIPANPDAVTASGYTNLEIWLHSMAAQVEGRVAQSTARPPANFVVN